MDKKLRKYKKDWDLGLWEINKNRKRDNGLRKHRDTKTGE